ncbi:hypothetical protein [Nitratiruptor sp. SB155-2]|uniref:hypothetical protein n=1 Tax=Nitratiruptor sp. (strain SB155-2) TaxID=387092 RepID=UPI0001586F5A|nr:hypothetical protein [Nitratiruptor sp. SB155-2]BAF69589.1 hypothetical protein NIS_0475 [Nitratiruptor sp. SB155-2]BAN05351.1 hypothetical protein [Nitratiruptor phage NrS-1]
MNLDGDELEQIKGNQASKIVVIDNPIYFAASRIFLQVPWEYGGMGGVVGKKYEAVKDFLDWNNFEVKEWTPIFLQGGLIWAQEAQKAKG